MSLQRSFAWDSDRSRAEAFAREAGSALGLETEAVDKIEAVSMACDVIVACTTAREPYLMPGHVEPGSFVAAGGADSPEKSEGHPDLMAKARGVVDVLGQCGEMGDLRHAISAGAMGGEDAHAGVGAPG